MVVESIADPFFSEMVAAVEKSESTHGKSVLVASTHGDAARERDVVAQMLSRRVCGMLLAPTTGDHAWLHTTTPLVLVDRPAPGLDADVVGIDDEAAAADAVDHLIAHGHRGSPTSATTRWCRHLGRGWPGTGAPWPPTRSTSTHGWSAPSARTRRQRRQLHEIFWPATSDPPTAVFSAATRCSLGVVPALHDIGRTDVALVCFGDFAMADLLQPGITVVDHSAEAVGAAAAARLAERIAQPDLPASIVHVPVG